MSGKNIKLFGGALAFVLLGAGMLCAQTKPRKMVMMKRPAVKLQPTSAAKMLKLAKVHNALKLNVAKLAVVQKKKTGFGKLKKLKVRKFRYQKPAVVKRRLRKYKRPRVTIKNSKGFKEIVDRGKRAMTFKQYKKRFPVKAFKPLKLIPRVSMVHFIRLYSPTVYPNGKVAIVVEQNLLNACRAKLNRYIEDIANQGYYGFLLSYSGGSAASLKSKLKKYKDLVGAILVGDTPVAWYCNTNDFHGNTKTFPCDLYFMDLNGVWRDNNNDGKYDQHIGDVAPEIFVARWPVHKQSADGSAASILNTWLDKNTRIRKGKTGYSLRGCAFIDNDWSHHGYASLDKMLQKSIIKKVTNHAQSSIANYKVELTKKLSWMHFACHSNVWHHSTENDHGVLRDTNIRGNDEPHAYFYQLFNCKSGRFTENNFIGGAYVFGKRAPHSLAAIASAKSGAMTQFNRFYGPMGDGELIGPAFRDWFAGAAPYNNDERRWWYGLTILGDPIANWTTPVVPRQTAPAEGTVFNHYPRWTTLTWQKVPMKKGTYDYEVQVDYKYGNKWASQDGRSYIKKRLPNPALTFQFVGAQPGRWRVRTIRKKGNVRCPWSPWRTFRYTR